MGLYARHRDPLGVHPDVIAEQMRPALALWFTGHIRIYDQALLKVERPAFDPFAASPSPTVPEPSADALVYDSGPRGALIQPVRSAGIITFAGQPTDIQSVRFQALRKPDSDGETFVQRSGLIVAVVDGAEDKQLERFWYSLKAQPDSTIAWHHIMEGTLITGQVKA